tara:strand:- start:875 stop:1000 length:126 start_codon:yes stop_codon:yes gene_type:complete
VAGSLISCLSVEAGLGVMDRVVAVVLAGTFTLKTLTCLPVP